jgi:hypothetical protein
MAGIASKPVESVQHSWASKKDAHFSIGNHWICKQKQCIYLLWKGARKGGNFKANCGNNVLIFLQGTFVLPTCVFEPVAQLSVRRQRSFGTTPGQ